MSTDPLASSFRDPSGFLFRREGILYRQVNESYRPDYDLLMASGLYKELTGDGLLIPHGEVAAPEGAYKLLQPEPVAFISYPYEWCFSQLKDAALTTLTIQRRALAKGMSLKDATAYNIQFCKGRPILIDTLSFERYREGEPWVAYRQFCQHFLAPLALMAHTDVRLGQLLRVHIDGIPLDLASRLLPWCTRLSFPLLSHLHLHAATQRRYADRPVGQKGGSRRKVSRQGLIGILESLAGGIRKLCWKPAGTEWADYYDFTNYTDEALVEKGRLVGELIDRAAPTSVWDLGANTGFFSHIPVEAGIPTLAFDIDPAAVERAYRACREREETALLPLLLDLTNPSPALGWAHAERMALTERGPAGIVLALALVHHLAISNNVPLPRLAEYFRQLSEKLIIEFVPKSDSKVQKLLATREDIFPNYTRAGFEEAFQRCFEITVTEPIPGTDRILYLMRAKG